MDLDLGLFQLLFGLGTFYGVDLYLILIPGGDVDGAVDVLKFNAAIRRQRIAMVKLFA